MCKSHSEVLRAWQVKKSQHACHLTSKGVSQTDLYFCWLVNCLMSGALVVQLPRKLPECAIKK